jgi:hypothetical protein
MKTNLFGVGTAVALALGGCSSELAPGSESALLGQVCEPVHEQPLVDTETATITAGSATITATGDGINIHLEAAPGWELGDQYIGLGPGPESLTWYTLNQEPWVTGWVPSLDLHASLADVGVACGEQFKAIITGFARDAEGRVRVSALGDGSLGDGAYYSFYDVCCAPPPDQGCTLTQGYWKTHPEAWPVSSLVLGGRTYSSTQLQALLATAPRGSASLILAHQLIAAELNGASGASASPDLAAAHAWLAANGAALPFRIASSSVAGAEAVAIASRLAAYNEGTTGPGHCDD